MLVLLACADDPPSSAPLALPHPSDLPAVDAPQDPLVRWSDGAPVTTPEAWEARRREILTLLAAYEYGEVPPIPAPTVERVRDEPGLRELELTFDGGRIRLAVLLPLGDGPFPVLLGPNACGNASVDARFEPGDGWTGSDCGTGLDDRWTPDEVLSRGVALATWHQSDVQPDDPDHPGIGAVLVPDVDSERAWGAIGAWAFGNATAVAALRDEPDVGPIAVWGHSRRGKAALWAGALDPRIDGVWAHQSGTGGAALARSLDGEPIGTMNLLFPHWFDAWFHTFEDREVYLPFDQHLVIAALAPRPVRVTDGAADAWADPAGAEQAVALASPVFALLDGPAPRWEVRDGTHEVRAADWAAAATWWVALTDP